jgi:hypothetical protein
MKKFIVAALALISTVSPALAKNPRDGLDDYRYRQMEYDKRDITVHVVYFKSEKELQEIAQKLNFPVAERAHSLSVTHGPDGKTCTIYIFDPMVKYEPDQAGHELFHCLTGRFHIDG